MDVSLRPRRSKTSRMPLNPPGKGTLPDASSEGVSPRRASSILKGSVKLLASGRLGTGQENGGNGYYYDESLAEITVSLSKSSFLSSEHSSKSRPTTGINKNRIRAGDAEEASQDSSANNKSYAQFLDSFEKQPLPLGISPISKSESCEGAGAFAEEPFDDFVTAYDSPEDFGLEFDDLITSKPLKFTKVKVRKLRPAPASSCPKADERLRCARLEQSYWNNVVNNRQMTLGTLHRQTAEAFLSLGHAHMRVNNDCMEAMSAFQSSYKIFKAVDGPTHLSVGRALDAFGLAALKCKHWIQAKTALEEAFAIRFHSLGVWHVDTVETYNKIAAIYLHMGRLVEAADAYKEVYLVRKAIYGVNHPSVAISAHGLANVYLKLNQPAESLQHFDVALGVYRSMHLPKSHPTVARLLNDRKRLMQQFRDYFHP
jgi:hypothetical protein